MRWSEVEDLDGDAPLWRVPAARMKLGANRKGDAANDHLVPLSAPAISVLRVARAFATDVAGDALVFPGRRGADAPIGAGALGELYARAGYAGRHVPHGWRAAFSTVMNERRPGDRTAIDQALGHVPAGMSKVERAYNRAQHLELRRKLLDEWGALIAR
jgi:integrase